VTDLGKPEVAPTPEPGLKDGDGAYVLLADGSLHRLGPEPPGAFHVVGKMEGESFVPEREVRGGSALATSGQPGWMELLTGSFQPQQTSRPPFKPYVRGYMTPEGFVPSTRQVD
jgi:hypothetical protein